MKFELLLVSSCLFLVLSGCGDGRCPVEGTVTFDGKPLEEGTIVFSPADGNGPTTGGKIINGKYQLTGQAAPLPGKKIVRITAARQTGRTKTIPAADSLSGRPEVINEIQMYIPEKYNSKTTLSCEVNPKGSNTIDFELKSS